MKFENGKIKFEVSNLTHVVINNVVQQIEHDPDHHKPPVVTSTQNKDPARPDTRVWIRFFSRKGARWAKFRFIGNQIPELGKTNLADAELFSSPEETRRKIMKAMADPDKEVWFSGTYCNIKIVSNYAEIRKIREWGAGRKSIRMVKTPFGYIIPPREILKEILQSPLLNGR